MSASNLDEFVAARAEWLRRHDTDEDHVSIDPNGTCYIMETVNERGHILFLPLDLPDHLQSLEAWQSRTKPKPLGEIKMVDVVQVKAIDATQIWVRFSDGRVGVTDCSGWLGEGGPMIEPLRDEALFKGVFVQSGVPTWPNGFDIDAIALYQKMDAAGLLSPQPD